MGEVLKDILEMLVSGITELGSGIATGAKDFVVKLLCETNASGEITGASTFAMAVALFAGISLTIALTTKLFNWIQSLGN